MDQFLDTPVELIERHLAANVIAPLHILQMVLPGMLRRGTGTVITMTSSAGFTDPPAPAGSGGWGMGYGVSKGALHRVLGVLAVEHDGAGVRFFNLQPGGVVTERILADMGPFGFDGSGWAPPELIGAVVVWLATSGRGGRSPLDRHRCAGAVEGAEPLRGSDRGQPSIVMAALGQDRAAASTFARRSSGGSSCNTYR